MKTLTNMNYPEWNAALDDGCTMANSDWVIAGHEPLSDIEDRQK